MPLTVDYCKIVYLRLIYPKIQHDPDILRLTARVESRDLDVWIEPVKPIWSKSTAAYNGLNNQKGKLFLGNQMLKTTQLKTALTRFLEFITLEPKKPVLLVTHSSRYELRLLFKAIRKTGMEHIFDGVIERATDTVPIFKKKLPNLLEENQLTLKNLSGYVLKKKFEGIFLNTSYALNCLIELVDKTPISTFDLIANSQTYEEIMSGIRGASSSFAELKALQSELSRVTVLKLEHAKISYDILKDLSQEDDSAELHKYVNEKSFENRGSKFDPTTIDKIYNFFKKQNQRNNANHSFTAREKRFSDESGSSVNKRQALYKDYSLIQEQKELIDELDSLMAEQQGAPPNNDDRSFTREMEKLEAGTSSMYYDQFTDGSDSSVQTQKAAHKDYSLSQEQEELIDELDSLMAERQEEPLNNNDRSFTREMEKLEAGTPSIFPGQDTRYNDFSFGIGGFQEGPHAGNRSSMEEQNLGVNQAQRDQENMQKWNQIFDSFL